MRKILGRTAAAAALAALAVIPIAGTASASGSGQRAATVDRCWNDHGHWYCHDDHHSLLDLDLDLDLDLL